MSNNEIIIGFKKRLIRAFYDKQSQEINYEDPVFVANLITQGAVRIQALEQDNQVLVGKVVERDQKFEVLQPKGIFHDAVTKAPDCISIAETAKIIGTGRNRLLAFMRRIKRGTRYNEPYQDKIEQGLLDVKVGSFKHPDQGMKQSVTPLVTGKGLVEIQRLWAAHQVDPGHS